MKHEIEELGTVKLTIGIRKPQGESANTFTEYGISVLRPDQEIVHKDTKPAKKKKAHH